MSFPRVSVVIPCFQASRTVATTLETVLHQTLLDIEVIVVDDGSTDDLARVVSPFVARDPRVRVVRQANRGLAGARNRGIEAARADLVAPIDADDVWHPKFLDACVEALADDPRAPFAFAYVFRIDEDDRMLPYLTHRNPPRHDLTGLITLNSVSCGSAAVFRKKAVLMAGGYDETMRSRQLHGAEDWKLIVLLAREATPALVAQPLVGYRLDAGSMSQRDPARQLRAVRAVLSDLRAAAPEIPAQVFRDGETMMTAWLLPAFAARRHRAGFLRELSNAYVRNPRWILNPLLRQVHLMFIRRVWRQLAASRRAEPAPKLWHARITREQPFAYLEDATRRSRA